MSPIISGSSGSTGGGLTLLFSSVLSGSAAVIDTGASGIAATSTHLRIYAYLRTDEAVGRSSVSLTVNNDTAANYDWQFVDGTNVTASANHSLGSSALTVLAVPGASFAQASTFGAITIDVPRYAQTTGRKVAIITFGMADSGAANTQSDVTIGNWRNTAAISRMAFTPQTGGANFIAGSAVYIYGI